MQQVPEAMWDVWDAGDFTGPNRPVTRATVSKRILESQGPFRKLLFDRTIPETEIPFILKCDISRSLGADAGTMTLTFLNQTSIDVNQNLDQGFSTGGPTRRSMRTLGSPGAYTFRRGLAVGADQQSNPWGHQADSQWVDMFIPNRVIKTYQGYGTDGAGRPIDDTKLVLTGVWLIDKVDYNANGTVTLTCRDTAKLMIEQRLYPPIIPLDNYPLRFKVDEIIDEGGVDGTIPEVVSPVEPILGRDVARHPTNNDSSVQVWLGYNASVYGHRASDAFDGDESTYWLSIGNDGSSGNNNFEWIQAGTGGEPINMVRFKPWKGGYTVYVSVKVDGVWLGSDTIPYVAGNAGRNRADKPYVKSVKTDVGEKWVEINLPETYNADRVRLTFTDLVNSGLGSAPYRAGVYEFEVRHLTYPEDITVTPPQFPAIPEGGDITVSPPQVIPGNISDYTDIVKILCAWSGLFWPYGDRDKVLRKFIKDWQVLTVPGTTDSAGRVWGDFMNSGAYPVDPIDSSYWDNKSVMDGINQVKEILGFIFYIDQTGGVVWRPPNIWRTGNFVTGVGYTDESTVRLIDENKVLLDYGVSIDDKSLRSEIVVVSAEDPSVFGVYQPGFAQGETLPTTVDTSDLSLLGGQQRVMVVPNYPFGKGFDDPELNARARQEMEKFGFLTSLWIHWSYRKSSFKIPGMPAFHPDDQVRIYEQTTSETYIHYLQGVRSSMDLESGTWTMDIDTHWLGNGPDEEWVVNYLDMPPALIAYLIDIGQIPNNGDDLPPDIDPLPVVVVPDDIIRTVDDLDDLFDLPPIPEWPGSTIDWEDDEGDGWVVPPNYVGDPPTGGTARNCSNQFMWAYWGQGPIPGCNPGDRHCCNDNSIRNIQLVGFTDWAVQTQSRKANLDYRAIPAFRALMELFAKQNTINIVQLGSKACRKVKRVDCSYGTSWSNHSWGTAIDVNWNDYPHGTRIGPGDPLYVIGVGAESRIKCGVNGDKPVFVWGNWWSTPDPMHFQVCATPADLAAGLYLDGVAQTLSVF